jgi:excisionase family DNA binding protein
VSEDREDLLKPADVAKMLNVSHGAVNRWIRLGQIGYVRLPGGTYRIPRSEVDKLLREGRKPEA